MCTYTVVVALWGEHRLSIVINFCPRLESNKNWWVCFHALSAHAGIHLWLFLGLKTFSLPFNMIQHRCNTTLYGIMNIISSQVPQELGDLSGYKTCSWLSLFMWRPGAISFWYIYNFWEAPVAIYATEHLEHCMHAHVRGPWLTCAQSHTATNLHPLNCMY